MGLASITNGWLETESKELIIAIVCPNRFVEWGVLKLVALL